MSHIRVVPKSLEHTLIQVKSKAFEDTVVHVVGLATKGAQSILKNRQGASLLELDDVLVGNELVIATRNQQRGGLGTLGGRRSQHHGEDREKQRQAHDVGRCELVFRMDPEYYYE